VPFNAFKALNLSLSATCTSGHKQPGIADRLQRYLAAAEQHPAVAATMYHPQGLDYKQQLLQSYARYADGSANSLMAREAKTKK
jgi:hypothetical protein